MSKADEKNKELEETIKWIKERIVYIAENCDLKDTDNKKAYNSLKTLLNYIENSIPKEVIEKKIKEKELQKQLGVETSYDMVHLDGEIFALQELLNEK